MAIKLSVDAGDGSEWILSRWTKVSEYNVEKEKRHSVGAISIVVPPSVPIQKMRETPCVSNAMKASIPSAGGGRCFQ